MLTSNKYKKFLLLLFCLPVISQGQQSSKPYPNSFFITIDSVTLHYRIWQPDLLREKGKVLLVHGFCGSTFNFRENYDTLVKQGYKVVAVDLPGFGYSQRKIMTNQSQSNRSRLIWLLLDSIDGQERDKWNIVGHSMGGGTVEAMALMHPERTNTLTIIDGLIFIKNKPFYQGIFSLFRTAPRYNILISFTKKNYITYNNISRKLKSVYGCAQDSSIVNAYLGPLLIDGSAETIVNIIANSGEIARLDADGLKSLPVLVVWGKKDRTIPLRWGKRLKRDVPSLELKIIPGSYHMPMETHHEIFNRYLIDFLNKNNPAGFHT